MINISLAAACSFIIAFGLLAGGCAFPGMMGEEAEEVSGDTSEGQDAEEEAAEEPSADAETVDQDAEAFNRYAGQYRAERDMRKALNLTLPDGAGEVSTKVKLAYSLVLNRDGTFFMKTEDKDEDFQAAKREATIEIVRSVQAGKLAEAGYSESQFDEVAQISGYENFEDMVLSTAKKQMEASADSVSYELTGTFRTQNNLIILTGKNGEGKEETLTLKIRKDLNLTLPLEEQNLIFRKPKEQEG